MYGMNILLPKKLRMINPGCEGINIYNVFPKYLYSVMISSINTKTTLPKLLNSALVGGWRLKVGERFNIQIFLPKNLKYLRLGHMYGKIIKLPKGFKYLIVGYSFNHCIVLPKYIKSLTVRYKFNENNVLPESILNLTFVGNG